MCIRDSLLDAYRDRKLLEYYLDPVADKYGLSLTEMILLIYLRQKPRVDTLKELADITNMSRKMCIRDSAKAPCHNCK